MHLWCYFLLLVLIISHLDASRFGRSSSRSSSSRSSSSRSSSSYPSSSSRSSSSRSSSSRSSPSRGSSWGSSRSSSSYPTQSFGTSRGSVSRPSSSSSSSWGRSSSRTSPTKVKSTFGLGRRSSTSSGSTASRRKSLGEKLGFSRSRSASTSKSSYPKQAWGSGTKVGTPIGGNSFSAPKPASTNFGSFGSNSRTVGTSSSGFGAGGFSKPNPSFGSSTRPVGTSSSGFGAGGFSKPNPSFGSSTRPVGTSSSGFGAGGFSKPNPSSNWKSTAGAGVAGGVAGGSLGGGGFVAPKPAKTNFGSGLTNTNLGSTRSNYGTGGGGFVAPKPSKTNFGTGLTNTNLGSTRSNYGTGTNYNSGLGTNFGSNTGRSGSTFGSRSGLGTNFGVGNTNKNFGSSAFSNTGRSGSGFGKTAGVGLLGAGAGVMGSKAFGSRSGFSKNPFGVSQYSSFGKPKRSFGSFLFGGKKKYGAKAPGYGTNFGTNFAGGVGKYGTGKKGFSKKALGLGVAAGFLGGAALGVGGTMATYSAIHKYKKFKSLLHGRRRHRHSNGYDRDWDDDNWDREYGTDRGWDRPYGNDYHRNYYERNECYEGCPANSHCEWSFCDCNYGYEKKWGRCESNWGTIPQTQIQQFRPTSFDPFKSCSTSMDCLSMDMNLICNKDLTTQAVTGQCECRMDMKWNTQTLECQVYLDVDCTKFTYDTSPSAAVQAAVEKAQREMEEMPMIGEGVMLNRTETQEETLASSLLKQIDETTASEDDILEAYCRDVDAYSFEFDQPQMQQQNLSPQIQQQNISPQMTIGIDPERPPRCDPIPRSACAVVYDEKNCLSGWKLIIPQGELRFKWMSSYYAYRNDIETIGVRSGCTLTAFSDSSFNGNRISIPASGNDRWVALEDNADYLHMHEDIESVQCVCRL